MRLVQKFTQDFAGAVDMVAALRATHKRPGVSGFLIDHVQRNKKGGHSGRPVREDLRIDRTDPKVTVKTHRVEEQAPDGTWTIVHDERVESPAKRRPNRSV